MDIGHWQILLMLYITRCRETLSQKFVLIRSPVLYSVYIFTSVSFLLRILFFATPTKVPAAFQHQHWPKTRRIARRRLKSPCFAFRDNIFLYDCEWFAETTMISWWDETSNCAVLTLLSTDALKWMLQCEASHADECWWAEEIFPAHVGLGSNNKDTVNTLNLCKSSGYTLWSVL